MTTKTSHRSCSTRSANSGGSATPWSTCGPPADRPPPRRSYAVVGNNMAIDVEMYLESGGFPRTRMEDVDDDTVLQSRVRSLVGPKGIALQKNALVYTSQRRQQASGSRACSNGIRVTAVPPTSPPMSAEPRVAVIVPAYNEQRLITSTLRALDAQRFDTVLERQLLNGFRVIVIDNSSTDTTAEVVEKFIAEGTRRPFELITETQKASDRPSTPAYGTPSTPARCSSPGRIRIRSPIRRGYTSCSSRCWPAGDSSAADYGHATTNRTRPFPTTCSACCGESDTCNRSGGPDTNPRMRSGLSGLSARTAPSTPRSTWPQAGIRDCLSSRFPTTGSCNNVYARSHRSPRWPSHPVPSSAPPSDVYDIWAFVGIRRGTPPTIGADEPTSRSRRVRRSTSAEQ